MTKISKKAMVETLQEKGITFENIKNMPRADVEAEYNKVMAENTKEDKKMTKKTTKTNTTKNTTKTATPAPKALTKKAQTIIADIQAITPAYGDRLQTLPTPELTVLRRMLKDRARQLNKARKAEEAAEAKRNAEPKQTVAQKLAADAEQLVGYYTMTTNAKGHTYIKDTETGKTLAKVWATRKGVMMAPKAEVVNTIPDRGWEYHPGWASKFTLPLANMTEVWAVLDEYWLAKEEEVAE